MKIIPYIYVNSQIWQMLFVVVIERRGMKRRTTITNSKVSYMQQLCFLFFVVINCFYTYSIQIFILYSKYFYMKSTCIAWMISVFSDAILEKHTRQSQKKNDKKTTNYLQNTTQKTKDWVRNTNPIENRLELRCSGKLNISCSVSHTRQVNRVTKSVISHA